MAATETVDEQGTEPTPALEHAETGTEEDERGPVEPAAPAEPGDEPQPAAVPDAPPMPGDEPGAGPETPAPDPAGAPPPLIVICEGCGHSNVVTSDTFEGVAWQPQPSSAFQTCAECGGLGEVATGSIVKQHAVRACPACEGRGYIGATGDTPLPPAPVDLETPPWPGAVRDLDAPGGWR